MNIAIDYGNSFIKTGIFENKNLLNVHTFKTNYEFEHFIKTKNPENLIISSVNYSYKDILSLIPFKNVFLVDQTLKLPFKNNYQNPEKLGADRLAAAAGAFEFYAGKNILTIDFGTCITFDFVNSSNEYCGGSISPGIYLCFKAMHYFTSRLPMINNEYYEAPLVGNNTEESMKSGVINGKIAEINGMIERYVANYNDLKIFICGGDIKFFERNIKQTIFAEENLVLKGLNYLLNYNQ